MKVVQIVNNQTYVIETRWPTAEEARGHFAPNIEFEDAPDWVGIGFTFVPTGTTDEERWLKPGLPKGWTWDENGNPWEPEVSRTTERNSKIKRANADALVAYRAVREGKTEWAQFIEDIEQYIADVEATVDQEGYPEKVVYPDYPAKPQ